MIPLNDYILIKKTEEEAIKTETGIYIAKIEHEMPEYHVGIIKNLCTTDKQDGHKVKNGDRVVYKHYRNITYKGYEVVKFEDLVLIDNPNE